MRTFFLFGFLAGAASLCAQTPSNIEAVEYDPAGNQWFVSNGSSLLVTPDQGANWSFFGEAQASHGMEVLNGHLFAIGNNVIRAYDLDTAEEVGMLTIPGVAFLNGMGSHSNGMLVVSDFWSNRLYTVDVNEPQQMSHTLLAGNFGATPNGVVIDEAGNRAIVVCWGNNADILSFDLESGDMTTLVNGTGLGNLDGIDVDGSGQYYVSSWSPTRITRFSSDFADTETVVTGAAGLSSPADISYAIGIDTLGVANSGTDEVTFHGFEGTPSTVKEPALWTAAHRGRLLQVTLPAGCLVEWAAYDVAGREVMRRSEWLPAGTTSVAWPLEGAGGIVRVVSSGRAINVR
ncbi:MAG: hypothetical protein CBC74_006890 [Crocinitomicaceae bacterium TMED114]|nr:MAG: hypothetical protein CBC74_006890 [Crocinitomicaceae bacterium TMED114]